ncbi:g7755 [Coccomyxa elongata]
MGGQRPTRWDYCIKNKEAILARLGLHDSKRLDLEEKFSADEAIDTTEAYLDEVMARRNDTPPSFSDPTGHRCES